MFLYSKEPCEAIYQLLINKRKSKCLKYLNDSKTFFEYSDNMSNIYKKLEEHNSNKKQKILIISDDMIADMLCKISSFIKY